MFCFVLDVLIVSYFSYNIYFTIEFNYCLFNGMIFSIYKQAFKEQIYIFKVLKYIIVFESNKYCLLVIVTTLVLSLKSEVH